MSGINDRKRIFVDQTLRSNPQLSSSEIVRKGEEVGVAFSARFVNRRRQILVSSESDLFSGKIIVNRKSGRSYPMSVDHKVKDKFSFCSFAPQANSEISIQKSIIGWLEEQKISVIQTRICGQGKCDIITDDTIYEIKFMLDRHKLFLALGQALIYQILRSNARKSYKIVIAAGGYRENIRDICQALEQYGIPVVFWSEEQQTLIKHPYL